MPTLPYMKCQVKTMLWFNIIGMEYFRTMKNKRKHAEQADKAEELAKRKLAKLSKVTYS